MKLITTLLFIFTLSFVHSQNKKKPSNWEFTYESEGINWKYRYNQTKQTIEKSSINEDLWVKQGELFQNFHTFFHLCFINDSIGFALSDDGSYLYGTNVSVTHNGGKTWDHVDELSGYNGGIFSEKSVYSKKGKIFCDFFHSNGRSVFQSKDNGYSWKVTKGKQLPPKGISGMLLDSRKEGKKR